MHELSIAQEIIRIVTDEQRRHNFEKVSLIKLKAGGFSGIDGHALKFAFEVVRQGTCAARADIDMTTEPIKCVCRNCGYCAIVQNASTSCPHCKSLDIGLEADSHFEIVSLEVD